MIKKLAKYGNSHALVLDKALLEILNITDSSKLKLSTDGTSLIITPLHQDEPNSAVSETEEEALTNYFQRIHKDEALSWKNIEKLTHEDRVKLMKEIRGLGAAENYTDRMGSLGMLPTYSERMKILNETARKENLSAKDYHNKMYSLMDEFDPGLGKLAKEANELQEKLIKKYLEKADKKNK